MLRNYDAVVMIGRVCRTVQYSSAFKKGSHWNYCDLLDAYAWKYGEIAGPNLIVCEINLVK